ncbi:MAG: TetR/AcrR family transcriptional regulator [Syntrophaceae bacterium]
MGRKPRQIQGGDTNTRDRLLNAAFKEFDEKGYYLTNGDTITKRAGLGHGTFYIYFKNKNEVLLELLRRSTTAIPYTAYRNDPQYLMRHTGSPAQFEAAVMEMVNPLSEIPGLLKALFQGMLQDQEIIVFGMQIGRDLARMFKLIIVAKQKTGALRGCDARTLSEIMAVCLACSILMTASQIIMCSPEVLIHNLCGIITPVLFPDKHGKKPTRLRMPGLENDKKIRRELLKAAQEEFIAHGYFETKIAHIMQKSGYSRRTFYHYYKSKDELLKALFFDMLGSLYPQANMQIGFIEAIDATSIEDLVRILDQIMQTFDTPTNWAFLQGFFNSPDLTQVYTDIFALFSDPIMKKLVALQAQGQCVGMDPKVTSYIIVATVSYTAFLRTAGFIGGTMHKCSVNLAWFLFYFMNHKPSGN